MKLTTDRLTEDETRDRVLRILRDERRDVVYRIERDGMTGGYVAAVGAPHPEWTLPLPADIFATGAAEDIAEFIMAELDLERLRARRA